MPKQTTTSTVPRTSACRTYHTQYLADATPVAYRYLPTYLPTYLDVPHLPYQPYLPVPSSSKILHACAPYFLLLLTYHTIAPHQPGPSYRRTSFALLFILGCPTDTPRTDNSTSQK